VSLPGRTLYLVRHCAWTGQAPEAPLTRGGLEEAERLADFFAPLGIERLVSSPFERARQTLAPMARRFALPLEEDARLREQLLSAEPLDAWRAAVRRSYADWDLRFPGGETSREAAARGRAVVDELLAAGGRAAVATHGKLLGLLLQSFDPQIGYADWARFSNPDVFELRKEDGAVWLRRVWRPL